MSKVILLLILLPFIILSQPSVVKADHQIILADQNSQKASSITMGEEVGIATFGCQEKEQVTFGYINPAGSMTNIKTVNATGGAASLPEKYSFSELSPLTNSVELKIYAVCSEHYSFADLTINPVKKPAAPPTRITISAIGDLEPNKTKSITVSGLTAYQVYFFAVSKLQPTNVVGTRGYVQLTKDCLTPDSGEIVTDLGSFRTPGRYRLEIFKATDTTTCTPSGSALASQDFSVGTPTGQYCCQIQLKIGVFTPFYDADEDVCRQRPLGGTLSGVRNATACKSTNSFCEPQSSECFKSQTVIKHGKICIYPTDPDFENKKKDTNQYAECGSGGGKPVEGCNIPDPKNPGLFDPEHPGIATAIGCIHTNPAEFVKDLMKFIIGIGGGLAFLMMLLGVFQMLTSQGNPETLNAGRERLTSAVVGLLFIIFAVLFLQIIGAGILDIPGFKP